MTKLDSKWNCSVQKGHRPFILFGNSVVSYCLHFEYCELFINITYLICWMGKKKKSVLVWEKKKPVLVFWNLSLEIFLKVGARLSQGRQWNSLFPFSLCFSSILSNDWWLQIRSFSLYLLSCLLCLTSLFRGSNCTIVARGGVAIMLWKMWVL